MGHWFLKAALIAVGVATLAHAQATGRIDVGSESCPTTESVYVYSTPHAKTQKALGFLSNRTEVSITLTPRVAGYYLVEGAGYPLEAREEYERVRLHGYVHKSCVVIDTTPVEEVERQQPHEPPPTLRSGTIRVFPLNLGDTFEVTIGSITGTCVVKSTKDVKCSAPLPDFQAVIASQGRHEFLLGCQWEDSETCVNLAQEEVRLYSIVVHERTVTVVHSGWRSFDPKTGKKIKDITPVLSVLSLVR